jgi:hypothetical protein
LEKRAGRGGVEQADLTTEGKAILAEFDDIQKRKSILASKVEGERAMNAEKDKLREGEAALADAKKSGNFGPVNEILKVNRGKANFNDLASRAKTEEQTFTNLLIDFEKRVNNGDYSITNDLRFPENLKANNLRAQAAKESKELENSRQLADSCDYEKLSNAIKGDLRSKPPFRDLLAESQKEQVDLNSLASQTNSTLARNFFAKLPEKERTKECFTNKLNEVLAGLGTQEQYQTAMKDGQAALNQGSFSKAIQSAELALKSKPGDPEAIKLKAESVLGFDLQAAQKSFDEGDYNNALMLCGKHPTVDGFSKIAQGATAEKKVLDAAITNLSKCDYSFVEDIGGKSYSAKKPFVELLRVGGDERASYKDLDAAKQSGNWQGVQEKLGALSGSMSSKPCFMALNEWASKEKTRLLQASQQQHEVLDTTLQKHLMTLGVKVPKWLNMPGARGIKKRNAGGELSITEKDYYGNEANRLEEGYKRLQLLDKDRTAAIKDLRSAIKKWH